MNTNELIRKSIGLFFGSFNPIHLGHIHLANTILQTFQMDEIWLVVSPCNPLKKDIELLSEQHRLQMVQLAIADYPQMKACDIEFTLPRPSYTIDTLTELSKIYSNTEFTLIIGEDNWNLFYLWKDYKQIISTYRILVYPRNNDDISIQSDSKYTEWQEYINITHPDYQILTAPLLPISSTKIRLFLSQHKDISTWLHPAVVNYIGANQLYNLK